MTLAVLRRSAVARAETPIYAALRASGHFFGRTHWAFGAVLIGNDLGAGGPAPMRLCASESALSAVRILERPKEKS